MILGIDHVVVISLDLDKAVAGARKAGFTVTPGGTHKDGATHNALIAFANGTYIELIAPVDGMEGKEHRWFPRLAAGGGLVDICLESTDLSEEVQRIQTNGRPYSESLVNGRQRPDGVELVWKGSMPPGAVGESGWPFLIEDITPKQLRVSDDPAQTTHANGTIGIVGVTMLVRDLDTAIKDFEAITGRQAGALISPTNEHNRAALINFDHTWLMLMQPEDGEEQDQLQRLGAGPFAVTLRTHDGSIAPGTGNPIPHDLMGGARFELA